MIEESEEQRNSRLDSVALTEAINKSPKLSDEPVICCLPYGYKYKGSFSYRLYDQTDCLLCVCFDCCTWMREFQCDKSSCCHYNYTCFACCCTITFQ